MQAPRIGPDDRSWTSAAATAARLIAEWAARHAPASEDAAQREAGWATAALAAAGLDIRLEERRNDGLEMTVQSTGRGLLDAEQLRLETRPGPGGEAWKARIVRPKGAQPAIGDDGASDAGEALAAPAAAMRKLYGSRERWNAWHRTAVALRGAGRTLDAARRLEKTVEEGLQWLNAKRYDGLTGLGRVLAPYGASIQLQHGADGRLLAIGLGLVLRPAGTLHSESLPYWRTGRWHGPEAVIDLVGEETEPRRRTKANGAAHALAVLVDLPKTNGQTLQRAARVLKGAAALPEAQHWTPLNRIAATTSTAWLEGGGQENTTGTDEPANATAANADG